MKIGELLVEEMLYGAFYGAFMFWRLGVWTLLTVPICAVFYALSGAKGFDKYWRRWLCPAVVLLVLLIKTNFWWFVIPAAISVAMLHVGYGCPDPPIYKDADPASFLGRFWYKITMDYELASVLTRVTIWTPIILSYVITGLIL